MARPIRIEPRVEFEATAMGLGNRKGQRIEERRGSFAHRPSEILGPGFERRGVHRVACGAHLEDNHVKPEADGLVEKTSQFCLLLFGGESFLRGPVDVVHRRDPGGAVFVGRRRHRSSARFIRIGRIKRGRDKSLQHEPQPHPRSEGLAAKCQEAGKTTTARDWVGRAYVVGGFHVKACAAHKGRVYRIDLSEKRLKIRVMGFIQVIDRKCRDKRAN